MEEYSVIKTKQFRGCGFMTVCKYNNKGDIIYIGDKDSKIISAIDIQNYNVIGTFSGHNGVVWSLDISKDDNILVTASGDLTIGFFDAKNGTKLFQSNERCIPKFVSTQKDYLPENTNLVAIICEALTKKSSTYISIYDLDKIGTEKAKLIWSRQSKPNVMTWISNDEIIFGCDDGKIVVRRIDDVNGEMEKEYQIHSNAIKSIVWNKTYTHVLTSSLDCTSKHLNPHDKFNVITTYKSSVPINFAIWNYNDRKVILGGGIEAMNVAKTLDNDLNIKIYRTSDQKLTNHIQSHFGPIRFIDKAPNTKNFITASQDGSVKIYLIDEETNGDKQQELITYDRFGNGLNEDNKLTDETNKMLNLSWKPPKVKEQVEQKWIPGMQVPKNKTNDNFKPNNLTLDMDDKLEELKKQEKEQNSTIIITNLTPDIKVKDLYDLFDLYGRIEERGGIRIKDYTDSTIAFIKYVYPDAALKAVEAMDGYVINHCVIKVEMTKYK